VGEKLTLMVTSFGYDGLRLRLREEEPNAIITEPLPEEFDLPEADTFVECVTDKLPLAGGEKDCLVTIAEPPAGVSCHLQNPKILHDSEVDMPSQVESLIISFEEAEPLRLSRHSDLRWKDSRW